MAEETSAVGNERERSAGPLGERLTTIRARIAEAAVRAGRAPESVRLLAVSKTFPTADIEAAIAGGQRAFGESRVQEAEPKILHVHAHAPEVEWHMIGPLQRNKARRAAELFDVIQSLDRLSLAESLSRAASTLKKRLRVLVQVNIDAEEQKSGALPEATAELLQAVAALPALDIVGLMAIPKRQSDPAASRASFARLRTLAESLRRELPQLGPLAELSMGMSDDFEIAIEEGATWVRVGSALFGPRA